MPSVAIARDVISTEYHRIQNLNLLFPPGKLVNNSGLSSESWRTPGDPLRLVTEGEMFEARNRRNVCEK